MIDSFNKISVYCSQNNKTIIVRNYAFCIFVNSFKAAIEQSQKQGNREAKPQEIENIKNALLSTETLAGHVAKAEQMIIKVEQEVLRNVVLDSKGNGFGMSVVAGIVSAFIYSLLLLIVYLIIRADISNLFDLIEPESAIKPVGMVLHYIAIIAV